MATGAFVLPDLEQMLHDYADAAQLLHAGSSEEQRQTQGTRLAVDLIPGCSWAGLLQRRRRGMAGVAATHEVARAADNYCADHRTGPGIDVLNGQPSVISARLATETRWASWTQYAHESLGIQAVLSVPLLGMSRSFGALTLYFAEPIVDDQDAMFARATSFATHFTLALGCGLMIEHQAAALENRTVIGQAQGILMVGSRLTADTAFAYLQRLSQHSNRKLRDIAAEVVGQRGPIHPVPEPTPDQTSAHLDGNTVHSGGGAALPETAVAAADPTGG
ncbi:ANTAR domain-containing protein [Dermatophilaceae bacterium Sec6.4]